MRSIFMYMLMCSAVLLDGSAVADSPGTSTNFQNIVSGSNAITINNINNSSEELKRLSTEVTQARADAATALQRAAELSKKAEDAIVAAETAKTDAAKLRAEMVALRAEQMAQRAAWEALAKANTRQQKELDLLRAQTLDLLRVQMDATFSQSGSAATATPQSLPQ